MTNFTRPLTCAGGGSLVQLIRQRPGLTVGIIATAIFWYLGAHPVLYLGALVLGTLVDRLSQQSDIPPKNRLKTETQKSLNSFLPVDHASLDCIAVGDEAVLHHKILALGNGSCAFNALATLCNSHNLSIAKRIPDHSQLAETLKQHTINCATFDSENIHLQQVLRELVDGHLKEYLVSENANKKDHLMQSLSLPENECLEIASALDAHKTFLYSTNQFAQHMSSQREAAEQITSRVIDLKGLEFLFNLYKSKMDKSGFHSSGYELSLLAQYLQVSIRVYDAAGRALAYYGEYKTVISLCFKNDHYDALVPI